MNNAKFYRNPDREKAKMWSQGECAKYYLCIGELSRCPPLQSSEDVGDLQRSSDDSVATKTVSLRFACLVRESPVGLYGTVTARKLSLNNKKDKDLMI